MLALNRKLFRDLWWMKGQAVAIALVIGSGVATYIMSLTTLDGLMLTQAAYYRDYRFADVFGSLKRAPETMRSRIAALEGVETVETRVVAAASLDVPGFADPVTAQIVSLPEHGVPALNQLYLKKGRLIESGRPNEILISESFASAHRFEPGDHLDATIRGHKERLQIVGIALSPEYIYQLQPGAIIPDFRSFGIVWMSREQLESAWEMEGAFNDFAVQIAKGASSGNVVDRIDELLARYGGLGSYTRNDQISHRYLSEEFRQLRQMAILFPLIFLGVASFLLNVVVTRLVDTQRDQVAILKAFGYSTWAVSWHYVKLVLLIVVFGVALGIGGGLFLGNGLMTMYMDFYRFPFMLYRLTPEIAISAVLISAAAAVAGTVYSVLRAARVPPAEAMKPVPPANYRISIVERLGLRRLLAQPTRMIIRNLERRPLKALLSVIGIACACAIVVTGGFFSDSVDYMVDIQFKLAQRDDVTVTFVDPEPVRAMFAVQRIPGVERVEPFRSVPARLRFQHRTYRAAVRGVPERSSLYRLFDAQLREVTVPPDGVVLTDHLAKILGIRPGDLLTVEVLEGERPVRRVPVVGLVNEFIGVSSYMRLEALNRMMREGSAISGVYLTSDRQARAGILDRLKEMPRVAGASVRENALRNFYEIMARQVLIFAFFNTILAATIALGVVYNSARITLSERSRELASLRVLGFTRGEISYILLGELAILTLLAIPIGCLIGRGLCAFMISNLQTDLFRIPLVISPATYSFAATVVLVAGILSGWIVRRKLDHLDLVAVLKARE
ncbi:MAG: ABC transporter permease [Bryobacteraceae bacterium]